MVLLLLIVLDAIATVFYVPSSKLPDTAIYDTKRFEEEIEYKKNFIWNVPSDIEGMTLADKFDMGLIPENGVDTDGDGLSDKEEIETYKSDPLKSSTAGDLYTDGYKVEHNLDLFSKQEYTEKYEFPYNQSEEVKFTPVIASDFHACADPVYRAYEYYGYKTFKEYKIYNSSRR